MSAQRVISQYLDAARRHDWDAAFGFFADDVMIRIPGRSRLAGDHRGKRSAVDYIQTVRERYRHGRIELELLDMLSSDERVALLVRERFSDNDQTTEIRRANVYRVRDEKIAEILIFEADQYEVDQLLR